MKKKGSKKARRRLLTLTFVLFGIVIYVVSSVFGDWLQIMDNKRQESELTMKYNDLLNEEAQLQSDVNKLQDPTYVARYAREKYLYTKDGELIIRIPKTNKSE